MRSFQTKIRDGQGDSVMTEKQPDEQPTARCGKAGEHHPDVTNPPLPWLTRRLQQMQNKDASEASVKLPKDA
jgi:hypothetical protein